MINKQNISLYVGIAIPILMIIFVAGSIYLPRLASKPETDFLYTTGPDYNRPAPVVINGQETHTEERFVVRNGKLTKETVTVPASEQYYKPAGETKLYQHDVQTNTSQAISFEEAQKLKLNTEAVSPDSYEIKRGGAGGGVFPFFFNGDDNYNTRSLVGHGTQHKLNLKHPGNDTYNGGFSFLGWIIP